ncbi:MAG: SCP2 sterol-binding domain-containing protein [Anaerolineae bacterium]|nr:SCP2 sterol-binding domain-containing protein [Anaerolineae bacterium]
MYATPQALYATLDRMVERLQANEAFGKRIANANVSVAFELPDLEAEYTLTLHQGQISGAPGGADAAPLVVTLPVVVLDELLSGATSGESLYYAGKLRFRGDDWVAESAAYYVYAMIEDYRAARAEAN